MVLPIPRGLIQHALAGNQSSFQLNPYGLRALKAYLTHLSKRANEAHPVPHILFEPALTRPRPNLSFAVV